MCCVLSSSELVSASIRGDNQFQKWPFWFVLIGMVSFGATQVRILLSQTMLFGAPWAAPVFVGPCRVRVGPCRARGTPLMPK